MVYGFVSVFKPIQPICDYLDENLYKFKRKLMERWFFSSKAKALMEILH